MSTTSIEWTDRSVNPVRARNKRTGATGHYCQKVSSGCANCYSSAFQPRFHMPTFGGRTKLPPLPVIGEGGAVSVSDEVEVFFDHSRLEEVLRRRKPTKFFWCDMTDLFGEWVPFEWIDRCFAVMALTPQHTHQVLTKRPERMAEYLNDRRARVISDIPATETTAWHVWSATVEFEDHRRGRVARMGWAGFPHPGPGEQHVSGWPLPNVWLGTSVENQNAADERIPHLLRCPAAVRFLSCEPLLGLVDLTRVKAGQLAPQHPEHQIDVMRGGTWVWADRIGFVNHSDLQEQGLIHWVIVGGESGANARPCDVAWIRSIVAQCKAAGVPCFVKQIGSRPWLKHDNCFCTICQLTGIEGQWPERYAMRLRDRKGGDPSEWPEDLRVREFPEVRP